MSYRLHGLLCCLLLLAVFAVALPAQAVVLEQLLSRENRLFLPEDAGSRMTVGRDGNVYVYNWGKPSGHLLIMGRDGARKAGWRIHYAANSVAANAEGVFAVAEAHFAHTAAIFNAHNERIGQVTDFRTSKTDYSAPQHMEVGAGGDFYASDRLANQIVRFTAAAKLVTRYPVTALEFRVHERLQRFYLIERGKIRCVDFAGKEQWTVPSMVWGDPWGGYNGGMAIDDNGVLYIIERAADTVRRYSPEGKALPDIRLQMGDLKPDAQHRISDIRVIGDELLLRRRTPTELFQRYDLTTGKLRNVATIAHERLAVKLPSLTWTAGEAVPINITLTSDDRPASPSWQVWITPFGDADWRELPIRKGQIQVPRDLGGLYQLKITAGTGGSEYMVREFIDVRQPGAQGTLTVLTPSSRRYYGRGEAIDLTIVARCVEPDLPNEVTLALLSGRNPLTSTTVAGAKEMRYTLPAAFTAALRPGRYTLAASAPGFTTMGQPLVIGPGMRSASRFRVMSYGDYGITQPIGNAWEAADVTRDHLARCEKLGLNSFVDRMHRFPLTWENTPSAGQLLQKVSARLAADPVGVAPEKANLLFPGGQTVAGYGAQGMRHQLLLLYMDAGLPVGTGFDKRTPEQFANDITRFSTALAPFPGWRGWDWVANWWVWDGDKRFANAEEKSAYEAALKRANETGAWDPLLQAIGDRTIGWAPDAQAMFAKSLLRVARDRTTASSGPYRRPEVYPPVNFANVDEVDLHYQAEQITTPCWTAHAVDYMKRPGKPAWIHPELINDTGTGEQILPMTWMAVMRGVDGVGAMGTLRLWDYLPLDWRHGYHGTISVYRALFATLRQYGPWLTTLTNADRVAVIVSRRQVAIDTWGGFGGRYFVRNWEAYMSLLYAHYPVRFLYLEDLQPETLQRYKAVFVVGQTVELEAEWRKALRAAQAAGVTVYADDTCRKEIVADFRPLGMGFNHVEALHAPNVDSAYWEFPERLIENSRVLTERLAKVVSPVAGVTNPEVLVSERIGGTGRYIFVVNNTHSALSQAQLSRMNMGISTLMPVRAPVKLAGQGKAVYDVFAMKQVQLDDSGAVMADLRTMGARLYAILPQAIDRVALRGPLRIGAGAALAYRLTIQGPAGAPIPANLPVRIRLMDANGTVIEARDSGTDAKGSAAGQITVPVNIAGDKLTLEATELISGKVARMEMTLVPTALRGFSLATAPAPSANPATGIGKTTPGAVLPAEMRFGTHLRDLVVTDDGKLAVASAFQWGDNLYAVDTDTGKLRWQRRVGRYWALGPHPYGDGVAVSGFDFNSAEGYHCYLLDRDGIAERRFATYGLPQQLATVFSIAFKPADPTLSFAVSPGGNWVAASGNMGVAVWQRDGTLLWSQDRWRTETQPHTAFITALDDATLLVADGLKLTAYDVQTGAGRWTHTLASSGEIRQILVKGGVCAVLTTVNDGRIYLLRNGKVTDVLAACGDEMDLSADGTRLVVTEQRALKLYKVGEGLNWSRTGDDILRFPRITADGARIAAVSELGTLYVCDVAGAIVYQRDLEAIAVPAFLGNRHLLLATWMGVLLRLDEKGRRVWRTRVSPSHDDVRPQLLVKEAVPTARMTGWTNNTPDDAPLPPVLPGTTTASITREARALEPQLNPAGLVDGRPDAPARPYLPGVMMQGHGGNTLPHAIQLDRGKNLVRLEAITLNEDETHPESWIRNASLEYWNPQARRWVFIQRLLADAPVHTHRLEKPVDASRFRLLLPILFYGNIRLKEVTLRGTDLGPAYPPDVRAKKPVATLFDENLDEMNGSYVRGFNHGYRPMTDTSAYSGANYFIFDPAANQGLKWLRAIYDPETWLFDVVGNPEPGQYRYLQLAIKALSPKAKRVRLSFMHPGLKRFFTIDLKSSKNWETYRVDLWQHGQAYWKNGEQTVRITQLSVECDGRMAFDQMLLGRSLRDLEAVKPIPTTSGL